MAVTQKSVNPSGSSPIAALFNREEPRQAVIVPKQGMGWLRILLDETLEQSQKLWSPPRQNFRGSEAGDTCIRSLTLSAMGHSVPFAAKTLRIFRTGNAVEDANMQTMRAAKIVIETTAGKKSDYYYGQHEIRYTDPPIIGHIDVKAKRPSDGVELVGEIKSINEWGFKALPPETDDPVKNFQALLKKKPGYIYQWNTYAGAPNLDLHEGFMLFEQKNVQDQLLYSLERDDDLLKETLDRMREAAQYITCEPMRVAPIPIDRKPRGGTDKQCGGCSRRYLCTRLPDEGTTYDEARRVDGEVRG